MEYLDIQIQAPIDITLKTTTWVDNNADQMFIALNLKHGMAAVYYEQVDGNGEKYNYTQGMYAIRVTDDGLQYYDYNWKYLDKQAQEMFSGYLAEKELFDG